MGKYTYTVYSANMDANKPLIFLLLVVVASSLAQQKCCFPDQYEVLDGQIVGTVESGGGVALIESVQIAFDFVNRRMGQIARIQDQTHVSVFQIIYDFNQHTEYVIDVNSKTCQKIPLQVNMSHCVPADAMYTGSFYIGDHKMTVDSFNYGLKQGPLVGNVILSVSKGDCIPFSSTFIGTQGGTPVLSVAGFVNYTSGIQDPSKYFTVPDYCPKESYSQKPKMYNSFLHKMFP